MANTEIEKIEDMDEDELEQRRQEVLPTSKEPEGDE